jgi:hypothetical protein
VGSLHGANGADKWAVVDDFPDPVCLENPVLDTPHINQAYRLIDASAGDASLIEREG